MAKLSMQVSLKTNSGTLIGGTINSGDKASRTECEAAIAAIIAQRVADAQGAAQDLVDAQSAFGS